MKAGTTVLSTSAGLLALVCGLAIAADETVPEPVQEELATVRSEIRGVEQGLEDTRGRLSQLRKAWQENDKQMTATQKELQIIQTRIAEQRQRVEALTAQQATREQERQAAREILGQQLRQTWQIGRHSTIRLLLNQDSADSLGRMLAWHTWQSHAYNRQLQKHHQALQELTHLRKIISEEMGTLQQMETREETNIETYEHFRNESQISLQALQDHIQEQERYLQKLRMEEKALSTLFARLSQAATTKELEFVSLRGSLDWPLPGRVIKHFGQNRGIGDSLKWQGALIEAFPGDEVHTIGNGRVVYADRFRGLDMLLIVDHGGGYMSLYGHNGELLKKKGDWVLAGEQVARVGEDIAREHLGLYFEIRKDGIPINPAQWCRN